MSLKLSIYQAIIESLNYVLLQIGLMETKSRPVAIVKNNRIYLHVYKVLYPLPLLLLLHLLLSVLLLLLLIITGNNNSKPLSPYYVPGIVLLVFHEII